MLMLPAVSYTIGVASVHWLASTYNIATGISVYDVPGVFIQGYS